ncbi:MAG: hypothetical protein JW953_15375 [Anaerolineae bacterium]|nr:hypothetical protein [Anaerolineae bacterium]
MSDEILQVISTLVPTVLLVGLGLFWLFRFIIARRWNKHRAATVGQWEAEGIEFVRGPAGGQFGGLESMGLKGVARGIGLAVMTDKDLRVTRASPPGVWCVTYKQIKGVTVQQSFMGHTAQKTPFIVVRFVQDGRPDKLGFQVNNVEEWAGDLAKAAGVSGKGLKKKNRSRS